MANKYEDLKNLSVPTAKLRTFLVRCVNVEVVDYTFNTKNGVQSAKKLLCDLVGQSAKTYARGRVRCNVNMC